MTLITRLGAASFDDVLDTARVQEPDAETLVVSWTKKDQRATALGLLDNLGRPMDVPADLLVRLTNLFTRPLHQDVLRIAFPRADLHSSGAINLNVNVHEPVWALILDTLYEETQAGLRVKPDWVRDALWLALEVSGVPSGAIDVERTAMTTDVPDQVIFTPTAVRTTHRDDAAVWTWGGAVVHFPDPSMGRVVGALIDWLAREERRLVPAREPAGRDTARISLAPR